MRRSAFILLPPVLLAGLFLFFPGLDLGATRMLHTPGQGFALSGNAFFDFVHDWIGLLGWGLFLGGMLVWLAGRWKQAPQRLKDLRRAALVVALTQLLGAGLLVNAVFKDQWGRARPAQVQEFGGERTFTPAWVVSDQCPKNCSFVCGDASVGFGLLAFAFVSRHRRAWFVAGLLTGGALGLMRMAQGGHFLSDVVFAFYAMWFTAWALGRVIRPADPKAYV